MSELKMIKPEELAAKERKIKEIENKIYELKAQGNVCVQQYKDSLKEIEERLGIKPEEITSYKEKLEKEILDISAKINELLPDDVLTKMASMDINEVINNKINATIDIEQDFGGLD